MCENQTFKFIHCSIFLGINPYTYIHIYVNCHDDVMMVAHPPGKRNARLWNKLFQLIELFSFLALPMMRPEVRIYKRKQESKKKRKKDFIFFLGRFLGWEQRVFFLVFFFSWSLSWSRDCFLSFFLDQFFGRERVFLFFLLSCFLL